ncbi:MAG: hypothetical protein QW091_01285 [Candidatus Micrarchaeaceae archaeon]
MEEQRKRELKEALLGRQAQLDNEQEFIQEELEESQQTVESEEAKNHYASEKKELLDIAKNTERLRAKNEKRNVEKVVHSYLYRKTGPKTWYEIVVYTNARGAVCQVIKH